MIVCCLVAFSRSDRRDEASLNDYRKVAAALTTLKDNRFYGDILKEAAQENAAYGIKEAAKGIIANKIAEMLPSYDTSEHKAPICLAASHALGCIVHDVNSALFKTDQGNVERVVEFLVYHVGGRREELTQLLSSEYARLGNKEAT